MGLRLGINDKPETTVIILVDGTTKNIPVESKLTSRSIKSIGDKSQIKEVEIGEGVEMIIGSAFYNCRSLTSVTIPDSVTNIGNSAFHCCSGLTSITIPNTVTKIGASAFCGCTGLKSITIPDSVKDISWNAFRRCSIKTVTFGTGIDKIKSDVFKENRIKTIFVPAEKTDYYKQRLPKELHNKIVELPAEKKN